MELWTVNAMVKEVGVSAITLNNYIHLIKNIKTGNGGVMIDSTPMDVTAIICENAPKPGLLGEKFREKALARIKDSPQYAVDLCRKYPKFGELMYKWRMEKEPVAPEPEKISEPVSAVGTKLEVEDMGAQVNLQNIRYQFMGSNIKYQGSEFLTSEIFLVALLEYAGIQPERIVRDQQNNNAYPFAVYKIDERSQRILNGFITDARFEFNVLIFMKAYRNGKKRLTNLY